MARVRDILYRFRPAGAPGAAGEAGVPVDRAADLAAELEPLFAQLADTEAECAALVEQARGNAVRRRARDAKSAESVVAVAREHADVERAAAATVARQLDQPGLASVLVAAQAEAEALRLRAAARIPVEVARVVEVVRAVGGGAPASGRDEGAA